MIDTAPIRFYELAGADDNHRFSPNCWRIRFALLHKQLPFEAIPWRFTEKEMIAFSGQKRVPIIVDGDQVVHDSWVIAEYLETTYPHQPALFGDAQAKALARFVTEWTVNTLHGAIARLILKDIYRLLHEKDKAYFRQTRETFFGATLDDICTNRETRVQAFRQSLEPLRQTLAVQPFLSGSDPAWADYVVFSTFQWARCTSSFALLETNDPLWPWIGKMLDLFGGEARKVPEVQDH